MKNTIYPFNESKYEFDIKKSTFIGLTFPIKEGFNLKDKIIELKKEYPKATHYCYAYKNHNDVHSSDDGEPSGTAGRPILECIMKNNWDEILIVVIRYFGGIKLGAGPLLRSYVQAAQGALDKVAKLEEINVKFYRIECNYSDYEIIKPFLIKKNCEIINTIFDEDVILDFISTIEIKNDLINITKNRVVIKNVEDKLIRKKILI